MAPSPGGGWRLLPLLGLLAAAGDEGFYVPPVLLSSDQGHGPKQSLPAANRHLRRRLTAELNDHCSQPRANCGPIGFLGVQPAHIYRHRRPRQLFRRKMSWTAGGRSSTWRGLPMHGCRIGEAKNPGPGAPGTPVGGERGPAASSRRRPRSPSPPGDGRRIYCPVPGCPCADPARAPGWLNPATMRAHVDAHLAGSLQGEVPAQWLQDHGRHICPVCGLSVSVRHTMHPTCRPQARDAIGPAPAVDDDGAGGRGLPDFSALQAGGSRTLRHVPAAARYLWGRALHRALAEVAHANNERAWKELFMLPQCVLCAPPRTGRRHSKAIAAYTVDRLQRWLEGDRRQLWEDRHKPPRPSSRTLSSGQRRELATALAREGHDRKACTALVGDGLCPDTPATAAALHALHPLQPRPLVRMETLPLANTIAIDDVGRALRSFPTDTAPGPSGLRVQHLREAGPPGGSVALLEQLTEVVNLLARGQACPNAAPVFAGASLVALPKPSGGVRPIAIGEVLRRLTGKCLMATVRSELRSCFWPVQVGVGTPAGAELAVHTVRAWMHRQQESTGKVLVKLDFRNAFNEISRQAVVSAAHAAFPGLARYTTWCYAHPSYLHFGSSTTVLSAGGVQQGDPLGPLLFAAAIQPIVKELQAGPLDMTLFYLDDGIIAGDVPAVAAATAWGPDWPTAEPRQV